MAALDAISENIQQIITLFTNNHGTKINKEILMEKGNRYRLDIMKKLRNFTANQRINRPKPPPKPPTPYALSTQTSNAVSIGIGTKSNEESGQLITMDIHDDQAEKQKEEEEEDPTMIAAEMKEYASNQTAINKCLNIKDSEKRRRSLKKLIHKGSPPSLVSSAYFHIGNSHETECAYHEAIKNYRKSMSADSTLSPLVIHHLCFCTTETNSDPYCFEDALLDLTIKAWQCSVSPEYKKIRMQWERQNELKLQMNESAACCLFLAHFHRDLLMGYNDCSLIWIQRALNLFEQTGCITDVEVSDLPLNVVNSYLYGTGNGAMDDNHGVNDAMIDDEDSIHSKVAMHRKRNRKRQRSNKRKKRSNVKVNRKRINLRQLKGGEYTLSIVEKSLMFYCDTIVERLRGFEYKHDGVKLDGFAMAYDEMNDFCVDEGYLRRELDQTFEILHHHRKWSMETSKLEQAELYTNYAAFLHDVLKHYKDAKKYNLVALDLNPEDATIHWKLAELYKDMWLQCGCTDNECYDEAINYYDLTLKYASKEERESFEPDVAESKRFMDRHKKTYARGGQPSKRQRLI